MGGGGEITYIKQLSHMLVHCLSLKEFFNADVES